MRTAVKLLKVFCAFATFLHSNRLNRRIFLGVPFARHAQSTWCRSEGLGHVATSPQIACLCHRIICRRCHFFHEQE
jgi:hypothetical protein